MQMLNGFILSTDLGKMQVIVNDSNAEIYYVDEKLEVVEGGEFSLEALTQCIQSFYESEF
jgi:hypothetical protein